MVIVIPDRVLPTANIVLEALCDMLTAYEVPPVECCIGFGEHPPQDDCCIGEQPDPLPDLDGQAWITIGDTYPVSTFPARLETVERCPRTEMAQQYVVGVYRCAPVMGENGEPPSCEELDAAAFRQTQDAQIIRKAIRCAMAAMPRTRYLLTTGSPLPPRGGCMGYAQTLLVALDDCNDCTIPGESS